MYSCNQDNVCMAVLADERNKQSLTVYRCIRTMDAFMFLAIPPSAGEWFQECEWGDKGLRE